MMKSSLASPTLPVLKQSPFRYNSTFFADRRDTLFESPLELLQNLAMSQITLAKCCFNASVIAEFNLPKGQTQDIRTDVTIT
ncbi:hypothetical protein Tcan_05659 [Toxocara canis]|uniref:Uncharacterized protein n=1 Tax=Toxocara canis TaxID=6265 RepID=A0A0B2VIN3_TOXCA|nr:hypothetical protein Tcan_05659 [Toxocara canis]